MLNKIKLILNRAEKRNLLLLSVGSLFLSLLETMSIGMIIPIMGLFVNQEKIQTNSVLNWFYRLSGSSNQQNFLSLLIISTIIIFSLKSLYAVFMLYKQQEIIGKIHTRITSSILRSYLNSPYSFHLQNNSSILFKNLNVELGQFVNSFLSPLVIIFSETTIFIGITFLLVYAYPFITSILIIILGAVLFILNFTLKKRIKRYSVQRTKYAEHFFKSAIEALNAVKEIQVYNVRAFFSERFADVVKKYMNGYVKFTFVSGIPRYILETLFFAGILIALLISIYHDKKASELIPMMTVMGVALLKILPTVNKIYSSIGQFQFSTNSLDILYDVLKNDSSGEKTPQQPLSDEKPSESDASIQLENITFCYESANNPILQDFNLSIPFFHTIALVGGSGAGKSTIIDIVMGLLIPSLGHLRYGKVIIDQSNVAEYRQKIGYVPQQIYLIDDTIEANIAFGISSDKIDKKQIEHVIRVVQLTDFVNDQPSGVRTIVGERGVKLSGGQRQRIGIARALYRNPEILILDEATSSLDGYTEVEVNKAIKNLYGKLTIIIVAHRLTTIEHADIIYVIEKGRIVDRGNFLELSENSAAFRKMAKH